MRNMAAVVPRLAALKATGVRIAIDDFGTGYSSLAYLQQFPVDTIKIDRSFISSMAESPESGVLIRTLVQLGKTLGLETLAEGIEECRAVLPAGARALRQRPGLPVCRGPSMWMPWRRSWTPGRTAISWLPDRRIPSEPADEELPGDHSIRWTCNATSP